MNRGKVKRKLLYQTTVVEILAKEHNFIIVGKGVWLVKEQISNKSFEQKINIGFVSSVFNLAKKHSYYNFFIQFQEKELQFYSKNKSILFQTTIYNERVLKFYTFNTCNDIKS